MIVDLVWEDERVLVESLLGSWGADHESNPETSNKGMGFQIFQFF